MNRSKFKEKQYFNETIKNYVCNYASLVADNIASYYKIYKNSNPIPLELIFKESDDAFILRPSKNVEVLYLVMNSLRERYNLQLLSENHNDIMKLKEID